MVRWVVLSCGGELFIPSDEPCSKCGTHPREVQTWGVPFLDDNAYYRCTECGNTWPQVIQ